MCRKSIHGGVVIYPHVCYGLRNTYNKHTLADTTRTPFLFNNAMIYVPGKIIQ